jgi:hypothetical protein
LHSALAAWSGAEAGLPGQGEDIGIFGEARVPATATGRQAEQKERAGRGSMSGTAPSYLNWTLAIS